jgi:small subunit ribosomal protein S8
MNVNDPIADLLTRIRNAHLAKHDRLDVPTSRLKVELVRILKESGFIKNYRLIEAQPVGKLRVYLRYSTEGEPAIAHMHRVSKPGRRVYKGADELQPVRNGLGIGIVSTSSGVMTDREAREKRLGGELLCQVW